MNVARFSTGWSVAKLFLVSVLLITRVCVNAFSHLAAVFRILIVNSNYIETNVLTGVAIFALSREWYFSVCVPSCWSNDGNRHKTYTRVSAQSVGLDSAYNIPFFLWRYVPVNDDQINDRPYILTRTSPSIAQCIMEPQNHYAALEKWYPTRCISILYPMIFMVRHINGDWRYVVIIC